MTQGYPVAPAPDERKGTLLDAANVNPLGDYRPIMDTEALYPAYNCLSFDAATDGWCGPSSAEKDFAGLGYTYGWRFVNYGGLKCSLVGLDLGEAESRVSAAFEAGESTGIEREFMRTAFATGPDNPDDPGNPTWAQAVDITPAGGAVKPSLGIALLESFIASQYVGQPLLHLPRTVASLVASVGGLSLDGNVLHTKLGSVIAAGAGYEFPNLGPDGTPSTGTERWLYATGQVGIQKGDIGTRVVTDPVNNMGYVLAERPYVGAFECEAVAIKIDLSK